ncbi:hypothetical protein MSG28_001840 [Choristoneura fumiferana]|uniref:Uncharacterized protein n=1 Tax=Choristoneura fumiferana TaxID=7141 RepID=A0ACC0KVM1_CHOFU|nr:hypothetical protein MSG28_001840 [Choristoneura fumiferana]
MAEWIHNSAFKSMTEAVRESEIKQRDPADLLAQPRHSKRRGVPLGLRWRRVVAPEDSPTLPHARRAQNGGDAQNGGAHLSHRRRDARVI